MTVAAVLSFCTNDIRFLNRWIEEAKEFAHQIVIPVSDHFFNGTEENKDLLRVAYQQHPDCTFIEFPYSNQELYPSYLAVKPTDDTWSRLWHNFARLIGFFHVDPTNEWVLFSDVDEIFEGKRMKESLDAGHFDPYQAVRMTGYAYGRKAHIRAKKLQVLSLLVRREALRPHFFYHPDERYALLKQIDGVKEDEMRGVDGMPLMHHYSWVRSEEEFLKKIQSWGHRLDQEWNRLEDRDLYSESMEFETIENPFFDPLRVEWPSKPLPRASFPNVIRLKRKDYMRLELEWESLV